MMDPAKNSQDDVAQLDDEPRCDLEAEETEVVEEVEHEMSSRPQIQSKSLKVRLLGHHYLLISPPPSLPPSLPPCVHPMVCPYVTLLFVRH